MALYGTGASGIPFTGFSPTLGVTDATTPSTSGTVQRNGLLQQDMDINRALVSLGNRAAQALFLALLGTAAGGAAVATKSMVVGSPIVGGVSEVQGGGVVPISTVTIINRATTATDVANLKTLTNFKRSPSTYVADLSGNGGGGKLGV